MPPNLNYVDTVAANLDRSEYMKNFQNLLSPGHEPNMIKRYNPKIANHFDEYLTPETLKKYVLNSPRIQLMLESVSSNTNKSRKEVDRKAKEVLDEIGLARCIAYTRAAGMLITRVGKRALKGIYVNEANLARFRDKIGNLPVLYLPCHRSYGDFVLMSYVFFNYNVDIPAIAAGNNLGAMPGMGSFLRNNGAFYMRRSFTTDDFYWEIYREYVHTLVTAYHIGIEFFIEGTRSRNFKALVPKIGVLSMTLEPLFFGQVPDVLIVPVSVSYDRVIEEGAFVQELLGAPKAKETTLGFFKSFKLFLEKFGSMYVDFGEPISAVQFFGDRLNRTKYANGPSYTQKLDKNDLALVKELAYEVVYRQQEGIVLFTFNLVAMYYAYKVFLVDQVDMEELCKAILLLKNVFERFGAKVIPEENNIQTEINEALEVHSEILQFNQSTSKLELVHPPLQMQTVDMKNLKAHVLNSQTIQIGMASVYLQMYINPCLFWVSGPAIMILAATKLAGRTNEEIEKDQLRSRIFELNALFSQEFVIVPARQEPEFYKNLETLTHFQIFSVSDRIRFNRNEISDVVLSSIVPFLCCAFHVIETILEKYPSEEFTNRDLMTAVQQRVEILLTTGSTKFIHPYCLALDNIGIMLASLVQNSFVEKRKETSNMKYFCHKNKLLDLRNNLIEYLELLPFTIGAHCSILSKL